MPTALPLYSVTRNFARAMHVIATTCLAGALIVMLGFRTADTGDALWPAIIALVPLSIGLYLADRYRRAVFSTLYLLVGGASVYLFTLTVGSTLSPAVLSQSLTFQLPALAVVLVGGVGAGASSTLRWSVSGFVVAQAASSAALLQAGAPWRFDWVTFGAFGLIMLVLGFARINRRRAAMTRPRFSSAARDELVSALRYRLELRAAALLHDTLLSHLAAVAATASTALDPGLAERMRRDLATLTEGDWLQTPPVGASQHDDGKATAVYDAIRDARELGLDVGVTGDLTALFALDVDDASELGRAVAQCLVNVLHHAGTFEAEVAVYGSTDEVLVMVVDTGDGFDVDGSHPDRLGLRHSIRGRIESVDGSVRVWSTPGRGTSVVLRVPVRASVDRPLGQAAGRRER